jgi:hypothetical protein
LNFLPLPQGHGSLRPTFVVADVAAVVFMPIEVPSFPAFDPHPRALRVFLPDSRFQPGLASS